MTTRNPRSDNGESLDADIRRQFGTEAMTRFLRTLPTFRTELDIPDRLKDLLQRLDCIEGTPAASQGGR